MNDTYSDCYSDYHNIATQVPGSYLDEVDKQLERESLMISDMVFGFWRCSNRRKFLTKLSNPSNKELFCPAR